jgi:hypothetical protein
LNYVVFGLFSAFRLVIERPESHFRLISVRQLAYFGHCNTSNNLSTEKVLFTAIVCLRTTATFSRIKLWCDDLNKLVLYLQVAHRKLTCMCELRKILFSPFFSNCFILNTAQNEEHRRSKKRQIGLFYYAMICSITRV